MFLCKLAKTFFSKIAIIAQKRSVNLKRVFQHPLRSLFWVLSNSMGTLKKTTKSLLMHKLEKNSEFLLSVEDKDALIIDAMAYAKQLKVIDIKYGSFAANLLSTIVPVGKDAHIIDVVFDPYCLQSIKNIERSRRPCGNPLFQQILPAAKIEQWNLLLLSKENKNTLIKFIHDQWHLESNIAKNSKGLSTSP